VAPAPEESWSAAAELNGQAEELAAMVASFRMEAGGGGARPKERARSRSLPGRASPGP
jgi:hypothetical protein